MSSTERDITAAARGGFLIPLAWCAGLQVVVLFVLSGDGFAWDFVSPLSALTMGAGYLGGLAMLSSAIRLRRWVDVRVAYVSALLLVVLMLDRERGRVERGQDVDVRVLPQIVAPRVPLAHRRLDRGRQPRGRRVAPVL